MRPHNENIRRPIGSRLGPVRVALLVTAFPAAVVAQSVTSREVRFTTADGVYVTADLHRGAGPPTAPMLLLFTRAARLRAENTARSSPGCSRQDTMFWRWISAPVAIASME